MAASAGGTPLRLKDLLELDCDSCSAAGFRCYPRRLLCDSSAAPIAMRHLLDSSPSLRRRRPSKLSHLSRSLSRRLSKSAFWRRRDEEEFDDAAAAEMTTATAALSIGCVSTSSEELETSSESSDTYSSGRTSRTRSRSESDSVFSSSATDDCSVHHHPSHAAAAAAAGHEEHEVVMKRRVSKEGSSSSGSEADDKEQLSPVGVMDFPFDDDDDELRDAGVACSPSFSLARLQRRKTHKIRRLGSRDDDELAPLDLEALLAATSESDPDDVPVPAQQQMMIQCNTDAAKPAHETSSSSSHRGAADGFHDVPVPDEDDDDPVSLLMSTVVSAGLDNNACERLLLLDLFVEMKRRRRTEAHAKTDDGIGAAVAAAARGWLEGSGTGTTGRWGLTDVLISAGAAIVAEMERTRRWMQVGEEEREVGAVVAGMLADQLVDEVVREFLFV